MAAQFQLQQKRAVHFRGFFHDPWLLRRDWIHVRPLPALRRCPHPQAWPGDAKEAQFYPINNGIPSRDSNYIFERAWNWGSTRCRVYRWEWVCKLQFQVAVWESLITRGFFL